MRYIARLARLTLLFVLVPACANIAGIEAGHLEDDAITEGGSGAAAGSASAGSASTSSRGGSATGGSASAGAPNAGSAGSPASGGGGTSSGGTSSGGGSPGGTAGSNTTTAGSGGSLVGEGGSSACPAGMTLATSTQDYPFCIDALEITNTEYLAFTHAHTAASTTQIAVCATNSSFLPSSGCASALNDIPSRAVPVVCVDWCDAAAYCASAGKRLCGRIGGVPNPPADAASSDASEWYAACVGSDDRAQSGDTCNGSSFDSNATAPKAASQIPDCEGGVAGLFDMSGNVAEWENSCDGSGASAACNVRGGSFQDGPYELRCSSANSATRFSQSATIGFRCCADAE